MCGIAGLVDSRLSAEQAGYILQQMTDTIVHRGPDDSGAFVADGAAIGMRRLSIIDVAGGHQPIANEGGTVHVVFNGEIYNYQSVRAGLEQRGHSFRTNSDTEVIAHLYEEKGADCLKELRGMFGIAVWDTEARRLVLGRDRLGKKPLFYAHIDGALVFGSEIKTLLAAYPALAEPDDEATLQYFRYGFVPGVRTMFRHISKLLPGHWLSYEQGQLRIGQFWSLPFIETDDQPRDPREVAEELDALLLEAVRIRLMSEVPLGVFLSGGLDSSAVVAYAHRTGLRPLKTFTIGFDHKAWDESSDAAVVAQHFQTDHHVLRLRSEDLAQSLEQTIYQLVRHFDEPFGDSSALPTYHVSKLAREHVTVILGGDGGDELFAGYSMYRGVRFAEHYRRLPSWLGQDTLPALASLGVQYLPAGRRYGAQRVAKVLNDSRLPFETMYFTKQMLTTESKLRHLFSHDIAHKLACLPLAALCEEANAILHSHMPVLRRTSYADMRFRLLDDILVKADRMSMAHSLEMRSPFLDHVLVEYAYQLPSSFKLRGWETKAILRDILRKQLPPSIVRKRKQGFAVPLREWLRTNIWQMVSDYLTPTNGCLPDGMFNHSAIQRILVEHRDGAIDHSAIIWVLLQYAVWHERYIRPR